MRERHFWRQTRPSGLVRKSAAISLVDTCVDHAEDHGHERRGFSAPRCKAGATVSELRTIVYQVGGAAVFLEPPAARLSEISYRSDQTL